MEQSYLVYYDSGTSNSRIYLLDDAFQVQYTEKKNVGSKDSSITGSNRVLIEGLWELYQNMLSATGVAPEQIRRIYASGMVTSPYGLKEVPHLVIPTTVRGMAEAMVCFREEQLFHQDIWLVPGLKTTGTEIAHVNNMRGEEMEILGTMETLRQQYPNRKIALIMPGSHTHTTLVDGDRVSDIFSCMTGELFYALKTSTILAAVLSEKTEGLDADLVRQGGKNLAAYGFNRAIYICHAMRLFQEGTPMQRKSYAEGVVNGDVVNGLTWCCEHTWKGCETAVIVSDPYMYQIYSALLQDHPYLKEVSWLPISKEKSYAVEGLKKILSTQKGE